MEQAGRCERATFAAGCFWDLEAVFRNIDGVLETTAGYTGGSVPDPDYEMVAGGTTGHVEAVGIVFDPATVSYDHLLAVFWNAHDPAQGFSEGCGNGSQYRSMIFYHSEEQKAAAIRSLDHYPASGKCRDLPVPTEILPAAPFWPAAECHQHFYEKCGRGYATSRQIE